MGQHDVMARLIYSAIGSLDGYAEDPSGDFQWGAPDDEVMTHLSERERRVGTYLYGRRMYEVMRYWEAEPAESSALDHAWAAMWRAASKVVYSRTLEAVSTGGTRLERDFDAAAVRALVDASPTDVSIGGAELAGQALAAGIVDELALYVVPLVLGGGKPWLPAGAPLELELQESRAFASGYVFSRYRVASTRKRRE